MIATNRDIVVWKGNDARLAFRISTEDDTGAVAPFDVAGGSLVALFAWAGGALRIEWPDGAIAVHDPAQAGDPPAIEIPLTPAQTRAMPQGRSAVRWELRFHQAGEVTTLLFGSLSVHEWVNDDA